VEVEGKDRTDLHFFGVQEDLIKAVVGAVGGTKPIVLVVIGGGQIDVSWEKNEKGVSGIIWAGYPNQEGGTAIADVIFGGISPAGRLSYTMYPQSYIERVPYWDMNMRPNKNGSYPGRTYRFYKGPTVYPFGYGLSYTTFSYKWAICPSAVRISDLQSGGTAKYMVTVTNTGKRSSDVVVLAYVTNTNRDDAPIKQLFDFTRVRNLAPGKSQNIRFTMTQRSVRYFDIDGKESIVPGRYRVQVEDLFKDVSLA